MKKVINNPEAIIKEMVQGIGAAYPKALTIVGEQDGIIRKNFDASKVVIVVGGGSGHEPMFFGYVGDGLADGAVLGHFFAAPNPMSICKTVKALRPTKGVLFLYGNYAGDVLNFQMASEMLALEGIESKSIEIADDIASAPKAESQKRRGIAGDLFVIKIAGAAAKIGMDLAECARVSEKANQAIASVGVGIAPFVNPLNGQKNFQLAEDEIEFGLGIHGEPGIKREKIRSADELVDELYSLLIEDRPLGNNAQVMVLVNGMGSTTLMELYIVNSRLSQRLFADNVVVLDTLVGNYCTTQEMAGFSLSLFLVDEELKKLYQMPAYSPFFSKGEEK